MIHTNILHNKKLMLLKKHVVGAEKQYNSRQFINCINKVHLDISLKFFLLVKSLTNKTTQFPVIKLIQF